MIDELKIGILGGGQLGTMLIRHAIDFGLNVSVLDKDPNAPCAKYTPSFSVGDPMSYDDVMAFGQKVDILTIEKEAVNTRALADLVKKGVKVYPSPETINIIQDKQLQKQFLQSNGIPVANAVAVLNKEDLKNLVHKLPGCLKLCKNGYDGKGVMMLYNAQDIEHAFDEPSILEEVIDIKHEISVIVSRNEKGKIECYDPVLMIFDKDRLILDFQLCPAHIEKEQAMEAAGLAIKTAEALNLVGILAVEMFLTTDNRLLVNELAPRPHNSGHHTIEACATSQYEQHLRAILGLDMGDTRITSSSVMINVLEPAAHKKRSTEEALKTILCSGDVHLHWYGKASGKEGRKMGHITITDNTIEEALSKATMIRHMLKD